MSVKHSVTAAGVDSGNGLISKNAWNADHVISSQGAKITLSVGYTMNSFDAIDFDQTVWDTDGFVSLGKASTNVALTGTVTTTAGSTTVTGSGTLFTTELVVGQILYGYGWKGTVRSIASNTSLTLWQPVGVNATSAYSRRAGFTIPTGFAGRYLLIGQVDWSSRAWGSGTDTGGQRLMSVLDAASNMDAVTNGSDTFQNVSTIAYLQEYEIVVLRAAAGGYTAGYPYIYDYYTYFALYKL